MEIMRAHDTKLRRCKRSLSRPAGDHERRLVVEMIECAKRQEALLSEVPGMEDRARQFGEVRAQAEEHHGLGGTP